MQTVYGMDIIREMFCVPQPFQFYFSYCWLVERMVDMLIRTRDIYLRAWSDS